MYSPSGLASWPNTVLWIKTREINISKYRILLRLKWKYNIYCFANLVLLQKFQFNHAFNQRKIIPNHTGVIKYKTQNKIMRIWSIEFQLWPFFYLFCEKFVRTCAFRFKRPWTLALLCRSKQLPLVRVFSRIIFFCLSFCKRQIQ